MKPITWLGGSFSRLKHFPKEALREAGYQLDKVQHGQEPNDFKPISQIGIGAIEIRIHRPYEYRVIYVAKRSDAIYVLHAFSKKTQKTPSRDLAIAKAAYAEIKKL